MRVVQYFSWAIGLALEILLIATMLRGAFRRFPILFTYCCALFCTTVIEVSAYTAAFSGSRKLAKSRAFYYWVNDAILQVLVFAVVISLIYLASARAQNRIVIRRWLLAAVVLIFAISFAVHFRAEPHLSQWAGAMSRDLNVCSIVLDLLLWSILIASRERDHTLLLLSGGLGIQFTGETIGQSLRQISTARGVIWSGNLLIVCASLLCLFVWWQALRAHAPEPNRRLASSNSG